jgi:1-acyl-sn-glycerol-3-phosphate acyltransferase
MFSAATAHLEASQAVSIFPEGVSHPDPALMPLRTGAARMLLEAEAAAGGNCGVASCRLVSSSTSPERSARGERYSYSEAQSPPPIASPSTRSLPTGLRAA